MWNKGKGKGKEKIAAEQQAGDPRGINYSSFLDDDDYFDDTYDGTSNFLVGSRFQPTDQELVGFYLRRKTTKNLPGSHDFIPLIQLYAPGAEPWFLHPGMASSSSSSSFSAAQNRFFLPRETTDWFFCFSYTTPRGPGSSRTAGSGSWVCNGGEEQILGSRNQIIGYSNTFAYKMSEGGKRGVSTNWVMHEYRLHSDKNSTKPRSRSSGGPISDAKKELVLCRIRCTKRVASEERQIQADGSFATGRKRRRTTTRAALIPDGPEDVEFGAPSVPVPPSAGPSRASSDFVQELFDWKGFERFVTGETKDGCETYGFLTNVPSP